jgi:predicted methyltransferase
MKPKDRAESVRAVAAHLGVGKGGAVADIGAGGGQDTWVFAQIVGETGTVFAQEIVEIKVKSLEREATKRSLTQVRAVMGREEDPCLAENAVDLTFLRYVYHHFGKPRPMLRGIWKSLKPGGYLVVVDKRRGALRDWPERRLRTKKHFWIAETTVVREAREQGFAFVECADACWHTEDPFVLVFQRPKGKERPCGDPDPFLPLSLESSYRALLPVRGAYRRPVLIALGEARELMAPILESSSGEGLEIVLEEWATQKDERPPLPGDTSCPSVLTENGDPHLGPEPIDVVFFLDSYHLLFHGKTLLAKLHEKLLPTGCIYVLDRRTPERLSRREASHRKQISPETVEEEMVAAGFVRWFRGPQLASDRFLLVFGKAPPERIAPEVDPFFGGPTITRPPGEWLKNNYWRLRGITTTDGKQNALPKQKHQGSIEVVKTDPSGSQTWRISGEKLELTFEKSRDGAYVLTSCQRSTTPGPSR